MIKKMSLMNTNWFDVGRAKSYVMDEETNPKFETIKNFEINVFITFYH